MTDSLISVIVPTYNSRGQVMAAVRSLGSQQTEGLFRYEIVVIDNGSEDNTRALVDRVRQELLVSVTYLYEGSRGYAQAVNRGLRAAKGDWVAILDDDEVAGPTWLLELFRVAATEGPCCVGGTIELETGGTHSWSAGPVWRALLGEKVFDGAARECLGERLPSGGNLLISRGLLEEIDLFDEGMVAGGSDSDFLRRAREAGYRIWVAPLAVVRHCLSPERLTREYARWVALRHGTCAAWIDCKNRGRVGILVKALARTCYAGLLSISAPASLRSGNHERIDRALVVARQVGYVRQALRLLFPRVFVQKHFVEAIDFRSKRDFKPVPGKQGTC